MAASGRITIRDAAARTEMSPATVSRVLSGNHPRASHHPGSGAAGRARPGLCGQCPARALTGAGRGSVGVVLRHVTHPFGAKVAGAVEAEGTQFALVASAPS
ncbi:hypothetical protein GCM10010431_85680 [Streptomyces kunmingensis]